MTLRHPEYPFALYQWLDLVGCWRQGMRWIKKALGCSAYRIEACVMATLDLANVLRVLARCLRSIHLIRILK